MRQLDAKLLVILAVLAALGLGGCSDDERPTTPRPPIEPPPPGGDLQQPGDTYWWNDQVFYEVFVRSFYDSDGDGIGDLRGLIQKLDYLNDGDPGTDTDLGVTALWLMPVVQSPSSHGYDATDYRTIESDYVMNHCSTQHPWFTASAADDPTYRDWFTWRADDPGWSQPWGGGQVYHYNAARGLYYYGVFWGGMPDLDYTNPAVKQEMLATADYWLTDMGADGFRLDAVKYLIEEGDQLQDTGSTLAFWGEFRQHLDTVAPEAYVVGEAWDATSVAVQYVDAGLHTVFEFDLATQLLAAAESGSPASVAGTIDDVVAAYPYHQYATFLTNHDQMRTLSQLGDVEGRNKVAAATLLTLPGVPFLFYGEEVGMLSSWDHLDVRRPMQWSAGANAGFTSGSPWQDPGSNYATNNVETMAADENSLWNHYRRFVQARAASVALQRGTYHRLTCSDGQVLAILRHHEDQAVVALHNFRSGFAGGWTVAASESQLAPGQYTATDLLSGAALAPVSVDAGGAIADWAPVGSLSGFASLLVELVPE